MVATKLKVRATMLLVAAIVAGCASQTPVEVVDGFSRQQPQQRTVQNRTPTPVRPPSHRVYVVQPYDNLTQIASFYRVDIADLKAQNNLADNASLRPGMRLVIPSEDGKIAPKAESAMATGSYRLSDRFKTQPSKAADLPVDDILAAQPVTASGQQQARTKVTYHTIRAGENIYRVGLKYGVSQFDIIAANEGIVPEDLKIGQRIIVPIQGQSQVELAATPAEIDRRSQQTKAPVRTAAPVTSDAEKYRRLLANTPRVTVPKTGFMWPVEGRLLKKFGHVALGVRHTGINIAAKADSPVRAARGGKVIYSGNGLTQFGNLILIRHNGGYVTAYAHNAANMVRKNQWVKKGDVIGFVGQTGNVTVPQLHFEVRKNARAVNPTTVLVKK